jgi:hypothetical protein
MHRSDLIYFWHRFWRTVNSAQLRPRQGFSVGFTRHQSVFLSGSSYGSTTEVTGQSADRAQLALLQPVSINHIHADEV